MIGNLRTRLSVHIPELVPDELGGSQINWVLFAQVWAHIKPSNLQERTENGRTAITQTYRVTIRWQRDFPERARLIWGARILRVLSASDPDTRKERLHLICEEEQQ
ncbi:MAG TPA: head-tail adaptor protein [Hellea balneolensis]|uniref:Head-tail adaptor protein n=1 Tax=Hellea balneolensis TaxID=287478 RepID=A0A7C3GK74_9PROT|nr:head-tail adaptor protein [Hellea balneolensis]